MKEIVLSLYAMNLDFSRRLVADIPDDQMCAQPVPGRVMNHAAFLLGHLTWTSDNVSAMLAGTTPVLPSNWADTYGRGAKPVIDRSCYRSKADLLKMLEDAHGRMADAFSKAPPELLARPAPERLRNRFPTVGHLALAMMTSHGAVHNGQISAWRRALGWPPIT